LGIPTAPFVAIDTRADLDVALGAIGLPAVLKTRRLGYDGKGQVVIRQREEIEQAWATLAGQPLILEGFVPFTRELSLLAVRSRDGATACYPLVENTHRDGILRRSIAPAPAVHPQLQALAESYAARVLDALGYVGVLAIELFQTEQQPSLISLIVNEMAPRVHNSGHWTIEGAETSQFENHVRAIAGLPLGSTAMRGYAAMVNLIGTVPAIQSVLAIPGAHLHLYEKAPRAGRKLGHITICADDMPTLIERIAAVEALAS
jgi:5-(carboxyamino)imidazole ribonucleotide synthase